MDKSIWPPEIVEEYENLPPEPFVFNTPARYVQDGRLKDYDLKYLHKLSHRVLRLFIRLRCPMTRSIIAHAIGHRLWSSSKFMRSLIERGIIRKVWVNPVSREYVWGGRYVGGPPRVWFCLDWDYDWIQKAIEEDNSLIAVDETSKAFEPFVDMELTLPQRSRLRSGKPCGPHTKQGHRNLLKSIGGKRRSRWADVRCKLGIK